MNHVKKCVPKEMKFIYLTEESIPEYVELRAQSHHLQIQDWHYKINSDLVSIFGEHKVGDNMCKFRWLRLPMYKYYIFSSVDIGCSCIEPKMFNKIYDEIGNGETEYVPLNDDLNHMLMSAVRYALGRSTYIVSMVCEYIANLIPKLSDQAVCVMERDIREQDRWTRTLENGTKIDGYGMEVDRQDWMKLLAKLQYEMSKRDLRPW